MKTCTKCKDDLELEQFSKHSKFKDGLHNRCNPCRNAEAKLRYSRGDVKKRVHTYGKQLYARYKMRQSDYDSMLLAQESKCLICQEEKLLVVDHCHTEGTVRGLLCHSCNTALGKFKDNVEILERAIKYLKND